MHPRNLVDRAKRKYANLQLIFKYINWLGPLAEYSQTILEQQIHLRKYYPLVESLEPLLQSLRSENESASSLDLGCGLTVRNPFLASEVFGVDIREDTDAKIRKADLSVDPIPFESNRFDFCTAFDFVEHIPRSISTPIGTRFPFVELMDEIHRVLKPGGIFFHRTPAYPAREAFQDPTHVNIITEDTMPYYFCEPEVYAKVMGYGFNGRFKLIQQSWLSGVWIVGAMAAIK